MLSQKLRTCRLALLMCLSAGTCASLAGCGKGEEKLVPVAGAAFFKDKPLTRGIVTLIPDKARGNISLHNPTGMIDAQGKYKIFTNSREGAPPGWYKVGIVSGEPYPGPGQPPPKSDIPKHYNDSEKSKFSFEVLYDAPAGSYDLRLQP